MNGRMYILNSVKRYIMIEVYKNIMKIRTGKKMTYRKNDGAKKSNSNTTKNVSSKQWYTIEWWLIYSVYDYHMVKTRVNGWMYISNSIKWYINIEVYKIATKIRTGKKWCTGKMMPWKIQKSNTVLMSRIIQKVELVHEIDHERIRVTKIWHVQNSQFRLFL